MFGVPPPNPDPQLEGRHLRTPKDRLESYVAGLVGLTLLLVVAAVVIRVL